MKELLLTIKGAPVARLGGVDLGHIAEARPRWFSYSFLELRAGTRWLRLDVEPETEEVAPSDLGADLSDRRRSSVTFETAPSDSGEINAVLARVTLRLFWHNPLTPGGRGLWIRLALRRITDRLVIVTDVTKEDSRIWSWHEKAGAWKSEALLPSSSGGWTVEGLQEKLAGVEYASSDGTGCPLLTGAHVVDRSWLVDTRDLEDPHERFRLDFLPPDKAGLCRMGARFTAPANSYRVNTHALLAEDWAATWLEAAAIDLTSARFADGSGFLLEWREVADFGNNQAHQTLSLNTVYQGLARHYTLGLASARSRNRLSFAPTRLQTTAKIRLHFELADRQVRLREVLLEPGTRVTWTTGAASEMEAAPIEVTVIQKGEAPALEHTIVDAIDTPRYLLDLKGAGACDQGAWIVNGVRVAVQAFEDGFLRLRQQSGADRYGQSPIQIDLRLSFSSATITPLSDDPEIGFETVSSWLDRERPVVVDVRQNNPSTHAEIREHANVTQSRVLRIGIRNHGKEPQDYDVDAVVLDPSPLTLARVSSTTTVEPGGLLAEYTDDSDQVPEWTFASAAGDMFVTLPPQVIGEEMIKGVLHIGGVSVPSTNQPFDFRLSPPARLVVDRTDIDTARTVAPWSLRRLLGQRTGVVGAKLQRARFELLYGLLSSIDDVPGLRIAELDALIGRMPFPDVLLDLLKGTSDDDDATPELLKLRQEYSRTIAAHIRGLLYRPSWWPVFRDFTARQQLSISGKGVSGALRPTRATADPFEIGEFHDHRLKEPGDVPLRGGVDWPFQSPKVYEELKNEPATSSLTIDGLAFGSLGGSGRQTAEFNDGKTLIISETTQGRLDSVTVIRIGRIAMLWNRARHVIVYERSTRRAPRYGANPPVPGSKDDTLEFQTLEFEGLAALRKVREYVEITERTRRYPDTSTSRPISGPLLASFFETTIIPVKSSWGYDVDSGFVIALRGPLTVAEQRFFPFPKIFLKQARARGKGEGTVDHQLKEPSELLFYTSTRDEDGGDTDAWAAVPDVDFPLIVNTTTVPLPFSSRFAHSPKQPDARPSDFGQARFTITLDPPEEAVDLMHGRLSEGIEARVSSVSMSRGRAKLDLATIDLGGAAVNLGTLAGAMGTAQAIIQDGLGELRMQVSQARAKGDRVLGDLGVFSAEAKSLGVSLKSAATELTKKLPAVPVVNWTVEQEQWGARFKANVERQSTSWERHLDLSGVASADVVRLGGSALETVCQQVQQRLNEAGFLPLAAMERINVAHQSLDDRARSLLEEVLVGFEVAVDRVAERYREMVGAAELVAESEAEGDSDEEEETTGLIALQNDLEAILADLDGALARFDVDALKYLTDAIGPWFGSGGHGLVDRLAVALGEVVSEARALVATLCDAMPPLEFDEADWDALKIEVRAILEELTDALVGAVQTGIQELRTDLDPFVDPTTGRLKVMDQASKRVEDACVAASGLLATEGAKALATFLSVAVSELGGLGKRLDSELNELNKTAWGSAPGLLDQAKSFSDNSAAWFDELLDGLDPNQSLEEVERAIQATSDKIAKSLEGAGRQVERFIVDQVRELKLPLDVSANGVGLELTRVLATGPVNDAIACTRERLGYYYDAVRDALDVTPASALFNDLGVSVLNPLAVELPFDKIRDRLLPQLGSIDIGQLLPSLGGLKLEHLFPDLKVPDDQLENDWIRIRHGFDKDRLTAFADVELDKVIDGEPTVFVLPPVALKLRTAHFKAHSRLELSAAGGKAQSTTGKIAGDWMLCLSDKPIVTMLDAALLYDSNGGFDFDFEAENVELAPEFQFLTNALKDLLPQEEGLTLTPIMPAGIRAELGLPLPDLTTGAFTLTGITLFAFMELRIADGFEVRTGFWLSKPQRPFGLAILFLGGGGWVGVEVSYRPPDRFVSRVSIGISAGAFVAVNFGFARGSAGILFLVGVDFYRDWATQSGRTLITLGILVWGEFSILGIASASLRLMLTVTYDGSTGSLIGKGVVEISIKICWCFTLRVNSTATQKFAGGSEKKKIANALAAVTAASAAPDRYVRAARTVSSNVAL